MEVTINIMDHIDQYVEVDICPSEVDLDAVVAHHGDDVLEYLCPKACLDYVVPDLDPETVIQAVVDHKGTEAHPRAGQCRSGAGYPYYRGLP
jgi:hypothetical protein